MGTTRNTEIVSLYTIIWKFIECEEWTTIKRKNDSNKRT